MYQVFARQTVQHMLQLRGWAGTVPKEVRDDVFHTLDRHAKLYSSCLVRGCSPKLTARLVQEAEWNA